MKPKNNRGHTLLSMSRDGKPRQTKGPACKHRTSPNTWLPTVSPSQRNTLHPKGERGRYVVNGVSSGSFILGDGKVHQGGFVIINGSHFALLLYGETLCESGPSQEFLFVYGPFDETFFYFLHGCCKKAEISLYPLSSALTLRGHHG